MSSVLTGERLTQAIDQSREKIAAADPEQMKSLDKTMAVDFEEHFKFQELQAFFHASGRLDINAAQIIYNALGEVGSPDNGGWTHGTDLATKVVVTQLMGELLKIKIAMVQADRKAGSKPKYA